MVSFSPADSAVAWAAVDKGQQIFLGRPLAAWVAERLAPQVDELLINANRNEEAYGSLGFPSDCRPAARFCGPAGGLHAALAHARAPLVATAPCDSPLLPIDLVPPRRGLAETGATIAVALWQPHPPVFCLCRQVVLPALEQTIPQVANCASNAGFAPAPRRGRFRRPAGSLYQPQHGRRSRTVPKPSFRHGFPFHRRVR